MSTPHRQPAGTPVGGQFAPTSRGRATLALADTQQPTTDIESRQGWEAFDASRGAYRALVDGDPAGLLLWAEPDLLNGGYSWSLADDGHELAAGTAVDARQAMLAADRAVDAHRAATNVVDPAAYVPPATPVNHADPDSYYPDIRGAKYAGWRPAAQIAKDVRNDIKAAVSAGWLPSQIRDRAINYAVRSRGYAGGQSITVSVTGLADEDLYDGRNDYGDRRSSRTARDLHDRLRRIATAYNQSRTDVMTDYFDETYYASVDVEDERAAKFHAYDKQSSALRRDYRKAARSGAPTAELFALRQRLKEVEELHWAEVRARNEREEAEREQWRRQMRTQ